MTLTSIGLDKVQSKDIAERLNQLLSNYQVFYMNARGFHWNIKGDKFFELHAKFEELYNDSLVKIDEIAERILTLGSVPTHTYSDYIATSQVKERRNISDGRDAVAAIIEGFQSLLVVERDLLSLSAEAEDEGTNALMSDYIREQEKLVWMYSAFLK
jgi:starvation-inducible DNA-binding protein